MGALSLGLMISQQEQRVTSIDSVIYAYLEEAGTYIVSVGDYNIFSNRR